MIATRKTIILFFGHFFQWCRAPVVETNLSCFAPVDNYIATLLNCLLDLIRGESTRHVNCSIKINETLGIVGLLNLVFPFGWEIGIDIIFQVGFSTQRKLKENSIINYITKFGLLYHFFGTQGTRLNIQI